MKRDIVGLRANTVEAQGKGRYRIWPNEMPPTLATLRLPHPLNRNLDHDWQQALLKSSSERRIGLRLCLSGSAQQLQLTLTSEDGVSVNQFWKATLNRHVRPIARCRDCARG